MTSKATIVIGHWSSSCSACGRGADYREEAHTTRLGYGDGGAGCGARFVAVRAEYMGPGEEEAVRACRPDLPFEKPRFGFPMGARLAPKDTTEPSR